MHIENYLIRHQANHKFKEVEPILPEAYDETGLHRVLTAVVQSLDQSGHTPHPPHLAMLAHSWLPEGIQASCNSFKKLHQANEGPWIPYSKPATSVSATLMTPAQQTQVTFQATCLWQIHQGQSDTAISSPPAAKKP
jgi:hypothetical protein